MVEFSGIRALVNEDYLFDVLKTAFKGNQVLQNVKRNASLKYPSTGTYMELDVWIPDLTLAFEFQDSHHYTTTYYYQNTQSLIQQHDYIKRNMAHTKGLTLIIVPCWWDGRIESLAADIAFHRPDLQNLLQPIEGLIPLNPPTGYFKDMVIPGVGELMLASYPPHFKFNILDSRAVWWMGEKYDGIRCCWNSRDGLGYSRYGRPIRSLVPFHHCFPPLFLDSELWFGRGQFLYTYTLVKGTVHQQWSSLRMISFDVPSYDVSRTKYEYRYELLFNAISYDSPINIPAARSLCKQDIHLNYFIQNIIQDGGEGAIIQKRGSSYEQGRSTSIIKMKTTRDDQEGVVTHTNADGSVTLKLPSGSVMTVSSQNIVLEGSSDSFSASIQLPQYEASGLKVGDIVSFSSDVSSRHDSAPNPIIYRLRPDLSWNDVLHTFIADNKRPISEGFKTRQKGHWSLRAMRQYLESFARRRGLDPLIASSWFHSAKALYESKSGSTILGKFKHGYYQALVTLFPEIEFDRSKFRSDYARVENRRSFFERYANTYGFDPLHAENWYLQPIDQIMSQKGAPRVIYYHNHSVAKALLDLFPNIGLQRNKFQSVYQSLLYKQ